MALPNQDPISVQHINQLLHAWIETNYLFKDDTALINELGFYNRDPDSQVNKAFRADVVLACDKLIGFEVKSEKDSLKRWPSQSIAYSNVFNKVWLCTHSKHLVSALSTTPKHIGILLIDDLGSIAIVRTSSANPAQNTYDLATMLWKEELIELSKLHDIMVKTSMTKRVLRELIQEHLSTDQVCEFVIKRLKARKGTAAS